MTFNKWLATTKQNKLKITFITIMVVLFVVGISLIQPLKYKASTRLLAIHQQNASLDAYQSFRLAERIVNNLSEIIYTDSFYQKVINFNPQINEYYPKDIKKQRKAWIKNVKIKSSPQTSMLGIEVYNKNKEAAKTIISSISNVLINQGNEYLGANNNEIKTKQVDAILISKYPVKPNFVQNIFFAIIAGLTIANISVIMAEKKYKETINNNLTNISEYDNINNQNNIDNNQKQDNFQPPIM